VPADCRPAGVLPSVQTVAGAYRATARKSPPGRQFGSPTDHRPARPAHFFAPFWTWARRSAEDRV